MNEDFTPFELAVKLKEKGFRMPCIAHYCCLDGNVLKFNITTDCIRGSNVKCLNGENNIYTDAPTIPQVLRWLRKEKKIVVSILPTGYNKETGLPGYYYVIYDVAEYFWKKYEYPQSFETWEECELGAIEYALDNLI